MNEYMQELSVDETEENSCHEEATGNIAYSAPWWTEDSTSSPGSLILGGKMRDPGHEVAEDSLQKMTGI